MQCSFHKLVLKQSLISQSGLLAYSNYLQLFGVKILVSCPSYFMNSPPYCPLPYFRHREDGYKDSRLRICFRVKSNGEFKCRCLPSCSMIYLKHPSFGIQLKHLTTPQKRKRSCRHLSMRNQKCMQDMRRGPIPLLSLSRLLVVFNGSFSPLVGGNQELQKMLHNTCHLIV